MGPSAYQARGPWACIRLAPRWMERRKITFSLGLQAMGLEDYKNFPGPHLGLVLHGRSLSPQPLPSSHRLQVPHLLIQASGVRPGPAEAPVGQWSLGPNSPG